MLCSSPEPSSHKGTILLKKSQTAQAGLQRKAKLPSAESQEGHQAKQQQQQRLDKRRDAPENHLKPTGTGQGGSMGHGSCCAWNALVKGNQTEVEGIHTAPEMVLGILLLCWGQLMHVHPAVSPAPAPVTGDRTSAGSGRVAPNPFPLGDLQQKHKAQNPPPSNQPRQDDPTQMFK